MIKKLIFFMAIVLIGLSSCKEEETKETVLTQDQAKSVVSDMSQDMEADVISMVESEGVESVLEMMDLLFVFNPDDFVTKGAKAVDVRGIIQEVTGVGRAFSTNARLKDDNSDDDFIFDDFLGIYEWNSDTEDFELIDAEVDYIEFVFPSNESTTNNSSLFVYSYEELDYQLMKLDAELKENGELFASIDFSATYVENEIEDFFVEYTVETLDLELYLKPFTYKINIDDSKTLVSNISFDISNGDDKMVYLNLEATFQTEMKMEVATVEGNVGYGDIKIDGSVDIAGIEDAEGDVINDYIDVKLYSNNAFVGDLELELTTDGEIDIFVIYSDGTSDSLIDLLEPTFDDIEDVLLDLEGV